MKKIFSVAVVALLALTVPALAGIDEGNGELGFDYGNTDYDSNTGMDSGDSLSLRGGYFMTKMFEIEGQYITADDETSVLGTSVETDMDLLMVNGVFNFHPREQITPYFRVGLGRANLEIRSPILNVDDSSMAYQFGGGSRFFFGKEKRAAIRVDLSFVNEDTFDESSTHTTLSGGFSWRLGS